MIYRIIFRKDGRELGSTPWDKGLPSAKRHARDQLPIQKTMHGATSAVVTDEDGRVVYTFPED
jgi:hypothetical protein